MRGRYPSAKCKDFWNHLDFNEYCQQVTFSWVVALVYFRLFYVLAEDAWFTHLISPFFFFFCRSFCKKNVFRDINLEILICNKMWVKLSFFFVIGLCLEFVIKKGRLNVVWISEANFIDKWFKALKAITLKLRRFLLLPKNIPWQVRWESNVCSASKYQPTRKEGCCWTDEKNVSHLPSSAFEQGG